MAETKLFQAETLSLQEMCKKYATLGSSFNITCTYNEIIYSIKSGGNKKMMLDA
jgi:hypothetical protein